MPRMSFSGFKDPRRRPRYIMWTGAALLIFAAVMITVLGITSTRWFCAEGCHKVQDDTILAHAASAHANVSCMACHMPVSADPVTFLVHKAEALGELYLTVTGNYELPLNGASDLAYEMTSEQCTQCHTLHTVTPAAGVVIDHDVHADRGVACTVCHNRVAHVEDFELTLEDPQTGDPNRPHDDFATMTGCFRCHSQENAGAERASGERAPGECDACHTDDFDLVPESHDASGFVRQPGERRAVHAQLALAERSESGAQAEAGGAVPAAAEGEGGGAGEGAGEAEGEEAHEVAGFTMRPLDEIDECRTCHAEKFCTDCHGVEVPHPEDFSANHAEVAADRPDSCDTCHLKDAAGMGACDECHHAVGDSTNAWLPQHHGVVQDSGADQCFECHDPRFCSACHVGLGQ